ncbi:MAG: hypothetical protein HYT67_01635 [Candidatus Yanofskybacteria bacterium]|nr:hypothetical protein [Candidatus Yanofskybacteria bacterium]
MTGGEFLKVIRFGRGLAYAVIIFVIAAGFIWGIWRYANRAQSHQFQGQVVKFSNDELELFGVYLIDGKPNMSDFANPKNVRVKINPNTKFVKTVLYMPTREELNTSKGIWDPAKLKQERQTGSLTDFKNTEGLGVVVKTPKNSMGNSMLVASEISYTVQIYPAEPLQKAP